MGREFESMRVQRAVRNYRCDDCLRWAAIRAGQPYLYLFGVVDGRTVFARFCGVCCASEFYKGTPTGNTWFAALAQADAADGAGGAEAGDGDGGTR